MNLFKKATVCYIRDADMTLMLHRNKQLGDMHSGMYLPPGGKQENLETSVECITREVFEETGLKIYKPKHRGEAIFFNNQGRSKHDWDVEVYETDKFENVLIPEHIEGSLKWVKNKDLYKLPMWQSDYILLDLLKDSRFFIGEFYYKNRDLFKYNVEFK